MTNVLEQFIDEFINKLYPDKVIPFFVNKELFIPEMKKRLHQEILTSIEDGRHYLLLDHTILTPVIGGRLEFELDINETDVIPKNVIEFVKNM